MSDQTVKLDRDGDRLVRETTQSNIAVKPVYNPADVADVDYARDLADPGQFPYTRGIHPQMFRDRLWLKSFIVSYATPEETNEAFRSYIANGLNDLRLLADLPTQTGLDPDHPASWNSMMCGGVATYAINVYEKMLAGLPMEGVTYELAHSNVLCAIYFHGLIVAIMENQGLDISKLRGNGIGDPIRAKLVYNSPDWTTEINRRVMLDHIQFCLENTPKWKAVAPNGVDPCQGGMNAVHELGEVIAVCTSVIEDIGQRGYSIDDYGSMVVAMDAESDFFETIAKFRAARRIWARIAKEKFGARTKQAMALKIGIRTSGLSLQKQKPLNNAARVTLQILSCVLGGVNSLDASSIDEAIGLPSYEARTFNLDTQHIITHEANIPLVADPLGGSYYVEWMTSKMEREVNAYLDDLKARGGIYQCLDSGYLNSVMEGDRLLQQQEKAEKKRLIIGVNSYQTEEEGPINQAVASCSYKVPSEELRRERVEEVKSFRAARQASRVAESVRRLHQDAKSGANVSRAIIDGAKAGLTIGEVCGVVRLAYGLSYDPLEMLPTPEYVAAALKEGR